MIKTIHWLEKHVGLSCVRPADLYETVCNRVLLSKSLDIERYSINPLQVTCKHCLKSYQFGQGNWRNKINKV